MKPLLALCLIALAAGCSNKLAAIEDHELADTSHECRMGDSHSPGMAIRCDNVARECARRRDQGRFVC